MKHRTFKYTKDNGDESLREVLIVSEARQNHLCYDVSTLDNYQRAYLKHMDEVIKNKRIELEDAFALDTGIDISTLWRSFKPENIEWTNDSN